MYIVYLQSLILSPTNMPMICISIVCLYILVWDSQKQGTKVLFYDEDYRTQTFNVPNSNAQVTQYL